jgi:alkylated DNA nucleotide flippase Atl1
MAFEADLPWWRVVRADGSLSQGDRQRKLLLMEDVPFRPGLERVDMRSARVLNP